MKTAQPPDFWFGFLFFAIGIAMGGWMAFDQAGLNAPLWVAEIAAASFSLAGASVMARSFGKERFAKALGIGVVYCLMVPGLWIALGSDGSGCSVSFGFLGGWVAGIAEALSCRVAFGIGGLITLAVAIALTYAALKPKQPESGVSSD